MLSKILLYLLFPVFSIFTLTSCLSKGSSDNQQDSTTIEKEENTELEYAAGFSIQEGNGYVVLTVYNPWQGAEDIKYQYLLQKDINLEVPTKYNHLPLIKIPIKKVVCMSTTHVAFLESLDELSSITGISGTRFVNNTSVTSRVNKNDIHEVGYEQQLNYEQVIALKPDVLFSYAVTSEVTGYIQKLKEYGIQSIMIAEYLEKDPRAKAEWIKFISYLYGKQDLATEIFKQTIKEYNSLKKLTMRIEKRPRVMTGLPWKGSWFMPGGNSYAATLINHAGARYLWDENDSHEAFPVDVEIILDKSHTCDYWINCGIANSKKDILSIDERLKNIVPFSKNHLFNNNRRANKKGGNDYWESGVTHPHVILKDLIRIFHPQLLPEHELVYYKKIE